MPSLNTNEQRKALMDDMGRARCIREAALMLILTQTGQDFDDETIMNIQNNVAAVAKEYDASPEDITRALYNLEPMIETDDR